MNQEFKHENQQPDLIYNLSYSPLFNFHDCGMETKYKIHYLKFEALDKNESEIDLNQGFSKSYSTNKPIQGTIGLKVCTYENEITDESGKVIELSTNQDIVNEIHSDALGIIYQAALKNTEGLNIIHDNFVISYNNIEQSYRRVVSRILSYSNMIAINYRRGPASYVILNEKLFKILNEQYQPKTKVLYSPSDYTFSLGGLKFYCSDKLKEGEVLVGRKGKEDEPGLHLTASDAILLMHFSETIDEAKVKLRYNLDEVEQIPVYYINFNFEENER